MVSKRIPVAKAVSQDLIKTQDMFINSAERDLVKALNLKGQSLENLAAKFIQIDNQSALIKGLILLEARERLKSNVEFGKWVESSGLGEKFSQQHRNQVINLAKFFKNRDMTGISVTAGYLIAAPENADVAPAVYAEVKNKGYSVKKVRDIIKVHVLRSRGFNYSVEDLNGGYSEESLNKEDDDRIIEGEFTTKMESVMPVEVKAIANPEVLVDKVVSFIESLGVKPSDCVIVLNKAMSVLRQKLLEDLASYQVTEAK